MITSEINVEREDKGLYIILDGMIEILLEKKLN